MYTNNGTEALKVAREIAQSTQRTVWIEIDSDGHDEPTWYIVKVPKPKVNDYNIRKMLEEIG